MVQQINSWDRGLSFKQNLTGLNPPEIRRMSDDHIEAGKIHTGLV